MTVFMEGKWERYRFVGLGFWCVRFTILVIGMFLLYRLSLAADLDDAYFSYINDSPSNAQTDFSEEIQGITHDSAYWYISRNQNVTLWRIPVGLSLSSARCNQNGVTCRALSSDVGNSTSLPIHFLDHIGDITYYFDESSSKGYLLLPLERDDAVKYPHLAVYSPETLTYVAHMSIPGFPDTANAPWVAVDEEGYVYVIGNHMPGVLHKFWLNWGRLSLDGVMHLELRSTHQLYDESGAPFLVDGQGAVFSENGEFLYLNVGYYKDYTPGIDGISVFDTSTWRRIRKSTNNYSYFDPSTGQIVYVEQCDIFCYDYSPGTNKADEPEGLTIWDLSNTSSPHQGQLHVLVLRNDVLTDDNFFLKHYTNKIYVDGVSGNDNSTGSIADPLKTVAEGNANAWDGSILSISPGVYLESVTFEKRMLIDESTGSIVIDGR